MMKTAKLFIDGDWYSDIFYMFDSNLANIVKIELDDIGVTDCEDGDWFEWHVENPPPRVGTKTNEVSASHSVPRRN